MGKPIIFQNGNSHSIPTNFTTNAGDLSLVSDTHFFIDETNKRIGFGTATPSECLHLVGDAIATEFQMERINSGGSNANWKMTVDSNRFFIKDNTAGVERFRIDNVGFVGIGGNTAPGADLDIGDAANVDRIIRFNTNPMWQLRARGSTNDAFVIRNENEGKDIFTIEDSAAVAAIHVNAPTATGDSLIQFRQDDTVRFNVGVDESASGFKISRTFATADFFVNESNGRVGIGTESPTDPLHVIGKSIHTDAMRIGGTATATKEIDIGDGSNTTRCIRFDTDPFWEIRADGGGADSIGFYHGNQSHTYWRLNDDNNSVDNVINSPSSTGDVVMQFQQDGTTRFQVGVDESASGFKISRTYGSADFFVSESTGRVGIGTESPGATLQVNGTMLGPNTGTLTWGGGETDVLINPPDDALYLCTAVSTSTSGKAIALAQGIQGGGVSVTSIVGTQMAFTTSGSSIALQNLTCTGSNVFWNLLRLA